MNGEDTHNHINSILYLVPLYHLHPTSQVAGGGLGARTEVLERGSTSFPGFSLNSGWEVGLHLSSQLFLDQLSMVVEGNPSHSAVDSHI